MKKRQNNIIDKLIAYNNKAALSFRSCINKCVLVPTCSIAKKNSLYIRLLRLDKPAGFMLLMFPVLWTVILGAEGFLQALFYCIFFAIGAIIMRSAGCIINDVIDKKLDKLVERTKGRPLASGELPMKNAIITLILLLVIGLGMLLYLPLAAVKIGFVAIVLIAIYPLIKRKSYFPQVFLGITFNIGVLIAWVTLQHTISFLPIMLYITAILWTVAYDTIYAYQDIHDDKKVGIKSLAIFLGSNGYKVIWNLYYITMILLLIIGLNASMNIYYYIIFAIGAYVIHLQVETLDLQSSEDCLQKFNSNVFFGFIVFIAFIFGRFL